MAYPFEPMSNERLRMLSGAIQEPDSKGNTVNREIELRSPESKIPPETDPPSLERNASYLHRDSSDPKN